MSATPKKGLRLFARISAGSKGSACALLISLGLMIAGATATTAAAQTKGQPRNTAAKAPAKPSYKLRITKEGVTGISLKAEKASLSEIASDLSRQLQTKIILSPAMRKELITVEFTDLALEQGL